MRYFLSSLSQPRFTSVLSAPSAQKREATASSDDKSGSSSDMPIPAAAVAGAGIAALVALLLIAALIATVAILGVALVKKTKTQVAGGEAVVSQADLQRVYGEGYGAF